MSKSQKIFISSIIISLLFHLLFFLLLFLFDFSLFATNVEPDKMKKIAVQLKKREPEPPPQEMPAPPPEFSRLVENPNANDQTPDQTFLKSDKSSVAAAPVASDETTIKSDPSQKAAQAEAADGTNQSPRNGEKSFPYQTFSKGRLIAGLPGEEEKKELEKNESEFQSNPSLADRSSATETKVFDPKEVGTFALNTYAWEYAPYMTAWLRYLQQHWVAPPAYTQLGLISGKTLVRFRIYPDGHMEQFSILSHDGHQSLEISSSNAVNASFPFKPLPDDFPEEYLEITLMMIYPDLRQLAR